MATDYGTDISCTTDIDHYFTLATGVTVVAQALVRRLTTPRGGLLSEPEYGYDLRQLVNQPLGQGFEFAARSEIEAQCLYDERVAEVDVTISVVEEQATVSLLVTLVEDEAFPLVLAVSAVSVEVLESPQ